MRSKFPFLFCLFIIMVLIVAPSSSTLKAQSSGVTLPKAGAVELLASPDDWGWQIQTLEVRGTVGEYVSMVLDEDGYPHISYAAPSGIFSALKYAHWDGVAWHAEVIDSADVGQYTSIALDDYGRPSISYHDVANRDLKYAQKTDTGWQVETVDSGLDVGRFSSMDIDPITEIPHISYWAALEGELRHARFYAGRWHFQVIDEVSITHFGVDLVVDDAGIPHVSYYDTANGDLKYAIWTDRTWSSRVIDSSGDVGRFPSLAYSGSGPHISYYDADQEALKYAHWSAQGWTTETVSTTVQVEEYAYTSIAVDDDDNPAISYNGSGLQLVRYNGSGWVTEAVDTESMVRYSSLAFDEAGNPHIAYFDARYADLNYAVWAQNWQFYTVDANTTNWLASLALHDSDPGITYQKYAGEASPLNYANWRNNTWYTGLVDTVGYSFTGSSLKFNADGLPRVAYYETFNQQVMYSSWDGSQWGVQLVSQLNPTESIGEDIVLLLHEGGPSIVYLLTNELANNIVLAQWDGEGWQFHPHLVDISVLSLDAAAFPVNSTYLAVSYYVQNSGDLRLATWDGTTWTDELADDGNGDNVGLYNSLSISPAVTDSGPLEVPVVAYYDATSQGIKYAHRQGSWVTQTVVPNVGILNSLSMVLINDSWLNPRLVYGVDTDNALRLAYSDDGLASWPVLVLDSLNTTPPSGVSMASDGRPRLAYRASNGNLIYAFPTGGNVVPAPIHAGSGGNVGQLLGFEGIACFRWSCPYPCAAAESPQKNLSTAASGSSTLNDWAVGQMMRDLYAKTTKGQDYIARYETHAVEMAKIGFSDPDLLWDSYRTYHNLMPGLEALVKGQGSKFVVTQDIVDQTTDIWNRFAAAASPELAAAINTELAKYNNMQDFVDLTFDEWAQAIGVEPPEIMIYLPLIVTAASGQTTQYPD